MLLCDLTITSGELYRAIFFSIIIYVTSLSVIHVFILLNKAESNQMTTEGSRIRAVSETYNLIVVE